MLGFRIEQELLTEILLIVWSASNPCFWIFDCFIGTWFFWTPGAHSRDTNEPQRYNYISIIFEQNLISAEECGTYRSWSRRCWGCWACRRRRGTGGERVRTEWWGRSEYRGRNATQRTPEPSRQPEWAHIKSTRRAIVAEPTEPCWRAAGARQQWAGRRLRLAERRGRGWPISAALSPPPPHKTVTAPTRVCLLTRISFVGKNNSSLSQVYQALRFLCE